jgi:signal recognition particle receptor subunit beta
VQLNFAAREVTIKLVYYGPALSGKTTNLRSLHNLTREDSRGRLMTLETKDDRTLFFDMMPLVFRAEAEDKSPSSNAMSLRLKVFTVPGQVLHSSTRRLVLQGADGVAFIADSQITETENNAAAFVDLKANLKELGRSIKEMPLIIQFNKSDLPNVRQEAEIEQLAKRGKEPVFTASAVTGSGVLESFFGLLYLTWSRLDDEHQLAKKLGLGGDNFLLMAARKLGFSGDVNELLKACVGGTLKRPAKAGRP